MPDDAPPSKKQTGIAAPGPGEGFNGRDSFQALHLERRHPPPFVEYHAGLEREIYGEMHGIFRESKPKTVHWSIAWSDLMMTMFVLFLVMYVYQMAHREFEYGEPDKTAMQVRDTATTRTVETDAADEQLSSGSQMYEWGEATMQARMLEDLSTMELADDRAVRVVLPSDLIFDVGRAELKPSARESLKKIADAIRDTPYMVNVVGHTDNTPMHSERFATNWELSVNRACAVARFLIEGMKLPRERFYVTGHADNRPLRPNNSSGNRAVNRRVEIIMSREIPYTRPGRIEDLPLGG